MGQRRKLESGSGESGPRRHPIHHFTHRSLKALPPGRHADGGGLYVDVDETGPRRWVLRVMVHGRRKEIGLGSCRDVSLAEARDAARELRRVARAGGDPIAHRDRDRRRSVTFREAADTVHREQIVATSRGGKHVAQWLSNLEAAAFPVIGAKPVHAVDQADVLRVLSPIWLTKPETARRVRQRLRTVLDWARTAGHREGVNPVEGVERGLPKQRDRVEHFKALPWADLPALWPRLEAAEGVGALALRFTILTAARSGETRGATWAEIDLEAAVWTIPAERMKAGRQHRVPLSDAALAILEAVRPLSAGPDSPVFPSPRGGALSDMTLTATLRRLEVPVTAHGFRSTFRDWAEEATAAPHAVKEAALAHAVANQTEAAYRRSDLLEARRGLMAEWAQFCVNTEGQ